MSLSFVRPVGGRVLLCALLALGTGAVQAEAPPLASLTQQAARGPSSGTPAGQIQRFEVQQRWDAYGGRAMGEVGPYEFVQGVVHGRLDPQHPANAGIVDITLAPRDASGWVTYRTDALILRPKDPQAARGLLFYDVVNRGGLRALTVFNQASGMVEPEQAGDALLMERGYTLVWSGWQGNVPQGGGSRETPRLGASLPVARAADGSPVTGMSREEMIFDNLEDNRIPLSYPPATLEPAQVSVTARASWVTPEGLRWDAPAVVIPETQWAYEVDPATQQAAVRVERPAGLDAGAIYSVVYPARDPVVMGMGFAAVRDLVSFLRFDVADAEGNPNPLADIRHDHAVIEGISQSGRFIRDFLWQGFNVDGAGRQLFDGAMPVIAGSRKGWTNFRWAQPNRWSRQHEDHWQPGDQFPFAYPVLTDPLTGRTDGILAGCLPTDTCPKIIHVDTNFEVLGARGGLLVTDGQGRDIVNPPSVRLYAIPGANHGGGQGIGTETRAPLCVLPGSNVNYRGPLRALVVALEQWVVDGVAPPDSAYGSVADGTLVLADAKAAAGLPHLSAQGVASAPPLNTLTVNDYREAVPVVDLARPYQLVVPALDVDGNERNGVRIPDVAVPLATHLSWNVRKPGMAPGQACSQFGATLPLPATEQERQRTGDSRPSLEARYADKADYVARTTAAAQALVAQRLLLERDVARYTRWAQTQTQLP